MDRVHRHGGVEGIIRERQRLGASLHHGRRRKRALADHPDGRLDGGNGPSGGLVGPGTRADIEDRTSIAQRILYHRADLDGWSQGRKYTSTGGAGSPDRDRAAGQS